MAKTISLRGKSITKNSPGRRFEAAKPPRTLNFCFVGCGKAARFHADVIQGLGHHIIAASGREDSPHIGPFSEAYGVDRPYRSWEEMLSRESPDAVVLATPWDETQKLVAEIVQKGFPCLVEKPVALDSERMEAIISQSRPFLNQVLVGYNRRFYESIPPLQEALERWPLVSVELNLPEAVGFLKDSYSPAILRKVLVYMSSHWYDLLFYLVGEISVREVYARRQGSDTYATAYNGLLWSTRFQIPIHLQSNFAAPSNTTLCFNFEDRIYRLSPVETLTIYHGMDREKSSGGRLNRYIPKVTGRVHASETYKPGFYRQMESFIAACVLGTESNGVGCTMEEALQVTCLLEQIESSARAY